MAGTADRDRREAQAKVLRAVLVAGEGGLTREEVEARCEDLDTLEVEDAIEDLLASGLLKRVGERLHPSGAATRFNRLRPL